MRTIKPQTKNLLDGLLTLARKRVEEIDGLTKQMIEVIGSDVAVLDSEKNGIRDEMTDVIYNDSKEIEDGLIPLAIGIAEKN